MYSSQQIIAFADEAAYRAARDGMTPLVMWDAGSVERDLRHVPSLGGFMPAGWRLATWADLPAKPRNVWANYDEEPAYFMVDASGFGAPDEPALTFPQAVDYVRDILTAEAELGFAIVETGQFQIVMGVYAKDPTVTEESGVPDIEDPDEEELDRCPACGDVIDYCQGHGPVGDPFGYQILLNHCENDKHDQCHPSGCSDALPR